MGTLRLPAHYRCTITCAFCGKRRHCEDECYHKQRLSAKLKSETQNGSVKGNTDKGKGKGKSQGRGKGQGQEQGRGPGRRRHDTKNQDKNNDKNHGNSGGNPNPTPGGNPEPSCWQQKQGPRTLSKTQAQREQGTKRSNGDGDECNVRKRSRFMRMAQKLCSKGFDVTCPAEF